MKLLFAAVVLSSCVGCSTSSPAYEAPDASVVDAGPAFDAGPSYITPGEAPDEHYPDGSDCSTSPDGGTDECKGSADCGNGGTCVCGSSNAPGNRCVASECRFDSECGAGLYCSPTRNSCFNSVRKPDGVYCHTANDRCLNDRDCDGITYPGSNVCSFVPEEGLWACVPLSCAAG